MIKTKEWNCPFCGSKENVEHYEDDRYHLICHECNSQWKEYFYTTHNVKVILEEKFLTKRRRE